MNSLKNGIYLVASTGISQLDSGLLTLENLAVGVIAGIGVIILAMGGFEFANAFYQHDTAQVPTAIRRIVSGVIMICIGLVIKLFV